LDVVNHAAAVVEKAADFGDVILNEKQSVAPKGLPDELLSVRSMDKLPWLMFSGLKTRRESN